MDIHACAKDIARQHAHLMVGDISSKETLTSELPTYASPVFASAWLGARLLGFVLEDADCIARAWQAQTDRTDSFEVTAWPCDLQDFALPALLSLSNCTWFVCGTAGCGLGSSYGGTRSAHRAIALQVR